jgi:calcineurin-like phosphoesterase family protein
LEEKEIDMPATFLVSDTHFGHAGVCKFLREDGTKLRPWDDPNEMDEEMIKRWNETVRPNDKVYHLGDVVINRKALSILDRLNGDKVLIKGNHDIFKLEDYTKYFRDIRSYHVVNGMILSHIPVHESNLYRFGTNIHGHLHEKRVTMLDTYLSEKVIDPRYFNVCVERTDFRPISLETVFEMIKDEGGTAGFRENTGVFM